MRGVLSMRALVLLTRWLPAAATGLLPGALRARLRHFARAAPPPPPRELVQRLETVVCDCDGVLFAHGHALPGAPEAVNALKRAGKRVLFVTNSATQSRRSLCTKLSKMGFASVEEADCVTSASAAAAYLKRHHPEARTAYIVGEQGLADELDLVGIRALGRDDTGGLQALVDESFEDAGVAQVGAVVVGLQFEDLGYRRLAKAAAYARDRARPFVATNLDESWPAGVGTLLPAGGACVRFVAYGAEREPDVCVGKPSVDLARLLVDSYELNPARTLMVGDRCNTDIAFGRSVGMRTLLVLSGCHSLEDVRAAAADSRPEFVADSIAQLTQLCAD